MIVDDEPTNTRVVRRLLERVGYRTFFIVHDATTAMDAVRRQRPDVILLDILMPEVSGFDILVEIRTDQELRHTPVLTLTAATDAETKLQALQLGTTDFLAKPVDASELALRVRNMLSVKGFQDHLAQYAEGLADQVSLRTAQLAVSQENVSQSYLAGKAEVATEVLHNVGNALNSVNVSASLIQRRLKNSQLPCLGKATNMLLDHAGRDEQFCSSDERVQLLPQYFDELNRSLAEEQQDLITEIELLQKHLDHIKTIVATQRKYAQKSGVLEPVSLSTLMQDAAALSGLANNSEIDIVEQFHDLPEVLLDRQKLIQVLVNLLRNAQEAMEPKSPGSRQLMLRIGKSEQDHTLLVEITDNGIGAAPENLTMIFAHGFTTKKYGRGIGLNSSANFIKEMGGSLSAASDGLGKGMTFTLKLPFQTLDLNT